MNIYKHELTELEIACGVTLEQVGEVLLKVYLIPNTNKVVLPRDTPPALAGSVARCALTAPCVFLGFNELKLPVYGLE